MNNSEFAFICDTPFQIFNAVNFVENDLENSKGKSDIYIYCQFSNAIEITKRLEITGLFNNVYAFNQYSTKKVWYSKLRTLFRILNPKNVLKKNYIGNKTDFLNKKYLKMVLSFYTIFSDNIRWLNSNAEVILIEDGTGSYAIENLETHFRSKRFLALNKYILRGKLSYNPQKFYVNSLEMCGKNLKYKEIYELPRVNKNNEALNTLISVFDYKHNVFYKNAKAIYLTQPFNTVQKDFYENEKILIEKSIKISGNNIIFRTHPRQTVEIYGNLIADKTDNYKNIWELECAEQINDNHILIAVFSTAQFVPQMIFGKKPYIIFLYKAFGIPVHGADDMIENFIKTFNYREKVYIPASKEDFYSLLADIEREK